MCKRHTRYEERNTAATTVYDGDTRRLNDRHAAREWRHARGRCGGFPWWTLWLIWPAIGLFKLVAASAVGVVGSIGLVTALQVVAAVVLIVAGMALLRRDRAEGSERWHR